MLIRLNKLKIVLMIYNKSFFFSSRRRHTRCGRDWSSDVCSSDLLDTSIDLSDGKQKYFGILFDTRWSESLVKSYADKMPRSEERRVGKECRSRWSLND